MNTEHVLDPLPDLPVSDASMAGATDSAMPDCNATTDIKQGFCDMPTPKELDDQFHLSDPDPMSMADAGKAGFLGRAHGWER